MFSGWEVILFGGLIFILAIVARILVDKVNPRLKGMNLILFVMIYIGLHLTLEGIRFYIN
jgi:hypothetical protein